MNVTFTSIEKEHNCEEHLKRTSYYDDYRCIEEIEECSICGAIKNHWAYGVPEVINWECPRLQNLEEK